MSKRVPYSELKVPSVDLGIYEHFRGDKYEVVGAGLDTETLLPVVIYKPLNDTTVPFWVRPFEIFFESVEVDGRQVERFKKINE